MGGTFRLVDPDPRYQRSFLDAADEFVATGQPSYAGILNVPEVGVVFTREDLEDSEEFARFVEHVLADRLEETPRPRGWVPATVLWIVEGDTYVGRVSLRHRLTPDLLTWGGHIGYGVRPSARGRGAATYALGAILEVAADHGIEEALVTCDVDNDASRRTIERNGGVYEDTREGKLRYWVRTRP